MKSNTTFTRYPIYVTQLVTTATVALVGAKDIGALLAARVGVTLVDICQHRVRVIMYIIYVEDTVRLNGL